MPKKINTSQLEKQDRIIDFYKRWNIDLNEEERWHSFRNRVLNSYMKIGRTISYSSEMEDEFFELIGIHNRPANTFDFNVLENGLSKSPTYNYLFDVNDIKGFMMGIQAVFWLKELTKVQKGDFLIGIQEAVSITGVPLGIKQTESEIIFYPEGAKLLDKKLINDNLEQQAQALFKSWFVDFEPFKDGEFVDSELGMIPKGWRVVCLGEVTKQVTEKVGNREDVTVLSPVNSGELVLSEEYFTKQVFSKNLSKYLIVNPLSFAYNPARINIGSIGLNEYDFVGCVSPVYVVFKCEPNYHYFFDFYKRTAVFKDEVALRAIGGVRQSLGYDDFSLIKTIYPTPDVVAEFNNLYLKMKEVITRNDIQNNKLTTLRDSLLPKLMSGELKINNFNR